MAYDANATLANTTSFAIATGTTSGNFSALDSLTGSNRANVMWARVEVTSMDVSTANVSLTFTIEHSSDNTNWFTHTSGADQVVTVNTGTPGAIQTDNVVWLPIATDKRYIRLAWAKPGTGVVANGVITCFLTNSHYQ